MPINNKSDLVDFEALDSRITTQQGTAAVGALRKFFTDYIRDVEDLVQDLALSESEELLLGEAIGLINQLEPLLVEAGLDDVIIAYEGSLKNIRTQAEAYFLEFGLPEVSIGIGEDLVNSLIDLKVDALIQNVQARVVEPLKNQIAQSTIALKNRSDVVEDITRVIRDPKSPVLRLDGREFTDNNIETLVNDSHERFLREVRKIEADELELDVVIYEGPDDVKTRASCKFILRTALHGVPGVYLVEELNADLHPDLVDDPKVGGGGFNCRHSVYYVTREFAEGLGAEF